MDRMNRLADDVEQASGNEAGVTRPSNELRTLSELELMLTGGGEPNFDWP
jgi:hypothetical protein